MYALLSLLLPPLVVACCWRGPLEEEHRHRAPRDGPRERRDRRLPRVQVAAVLVDVVLGVAGEGEERVDDEPARAALHDELLLGLDRLLVVLLVHDVEVQRRLLVLVPQEREQRDRVRGVVGLRQLRWHPF